MHVVDMVVLAGYLIGVTLLGSWMGRRVKSAADFFMPRRFGKPMMIMHAFGTGTASDQAVSVASASFRSGASGIWYQWLWLLATPFYWLLAPIMRRFRATTTADVLHLRFGPSVAILFAVVGILSMSVKIGVMLIGAEALLSSGTGGLVNSDWSIAIITVLFVTYGAVGGLSAAVVTDFVQGIMTLIFSFLLLPFVLSEVGGLSGVREVLQDDSFLTITAPDKIGVFFVIMFGVNALVGIIAQPHIMGVCAAGKTEREGRIGIVWGNLIKRICTVAWCLTGIAAIAWYMKSGQDPSAVDSDGVYGDIAQQFLPAVAPGLLGLFLASLLASIMSSCDSFMISSAGLFTENIYRPASPGRSARHYLWVGRLASLAIVAGGVGFAYWVKSADDAVAASGKLADGEVIRALKFWFKIAPMTGIVLWLSLVWRRLNVAGAWAMTVTGFVSWWLSARPALADWLGERAWARDRGIVWESGGKLSVYDPWQILFYLCAALIAGIVVSLLTAAPKGERVDRFYRLMRTPIVPDEVLTRPCEIPESAVEARSILYSGWGFEIPKPSRTSVVGFLLTWLAVAFLIFGFVGLLATA